MFRVELGFRSKQTWQKAHKSPTYLNVWPEGSQKKSFKSLIFNIMVNFSLPIMARIFSKSGKKIHEFLHVRRSFHANSGEWGSKLWSTIITVNTLLCSVYPTHRLINRPTHFKQTWPSADIYSKHSINLSSHLTN